MIKKIFFGIFSALLFLNTVNAVIINEIMYDPNGTDTGREWIELYNNNDFDVNISEWKLFESEVNHKLTAFQGSDILNKKEYLIIADNPEQFLNDYPGFGETIIESSFSLSNTGEIICIKDNTFQTINCVDYSSELLANGDGKTIEFSGTEWMESLVYYGTPGMENSVYSSGLEINQNTMQIYANVISGGIEIKDINISPDYYENEGFQIMPNAAIYKDITISAIVENKDEGNISSVSVLFKDTTFEMTKIQDLNEYEHIYQINLSMNFYDNPGIYEVFLKAESSSSNTNKTAEFEYLKLMAIELSSNEINFGNMVKGKNSSVSDAIILSNIGNVFSDIEMNGKAFTSGESFLGIDNLYYKTENSDFIRFSSLPFMAGIDLECKEESSKSLEFKLYIPENTKSGNYSSSLSITAIER
ncbi:MAG: lamin tail domain-containing protein [Candidatus Nanoarchaeia archaeon]|nr:lamin tail domain-containing protein [Candidatus Nanoarchaeia archaeon]